MGKVMDNQEKDKRIDANLSGEIEFCEDLLSFEFNDWRIKSLANKIKLQKYRPNSKIYNL